MADTANYFSVARADAQAVASGSTTPQTSVPESESKEDRATRKAKRIADAVERSKRDYTAENVYTERGVRPPPLMPMHLISLIEVVVGRTELMTPG